MDRSRLSGAHGVARGMAPAADKARAGESGRGLELKSGLTPLGTGVIVVGLAVVGYLMWWGQGNLKIYPPSGGLGACLLFAVLPLLVGLLILVMVSFAWFSNRAVTITVRREGLKYVGGDIFFDAKWSRLTYVAPTSRIKGMRSLVIGNAETRVRVDELFMPSFDRLVGFLENVMTKIEGARGDREIEI